MVRALPCSAAAMISITNPITERTAPSRWVSALTGSRSRSRIPNSSRSLYILYIVRLKSIRAVTLVTAVSFGACVSTPARSPVGTAATIDRAPIVAHVWLTTGDQSRLLNAEPDLSFVPDAAPASPAIPVIEVDASTTYQQIVGFGAAMTDASAYLFMHRMPAKDRE